MKNDVLYVSFASKPTDDKRRANIYYISSLLARFRFSLYNSNTVAVSSSLIISVP
jgi:hypothetical protein